MIKEKIVNFAFHTVLIAVLLVSLAPVANIYYRANLPIGADAFNFAHYVLNFRENMAFPISAWKMDEFEGMPRLVDDSWLHFYLIQPLVSAIGFFPADKLYPLIFMGLFLVSSYLLFWEISHSKLLAFGLAVLLSRTGAIYISLYSGGVVVSSISQTFYPLMLYFFVRFVRTESKKDLIMAAVSLALGLYSHLGVFGSMGIPTAGIFLLLFSTKNIKWLEIKKKIGHWLIFALMAAMIGALVLGPEAWAKFIDGGHQWLSPVWQPAWWTFSSLINATNPTTWLVIILSVVWGLIYKKAYRNRLIWPFLGILTYFLLFQGASFLGLNPLSGHIFPHRVHFVFSVAVLASVAILLTQNGEQVRPRTHKLLIAGIALICFLGGLMFPLRQVLNYLDQSTYDGKNALPYLATDPRHDYGKVFWDLTLAKPNFIKDDRSYRLQAFDYTYNISAQMATDLPLARGVFHYSDRRNVDWYAWQVAVLAQETINEKRIDPFVMKQQAQFVLDWYSIKYLFSNPDEKQQIASFLRDKKTPFVADVSGEDEASNLIRIKDNAVSPIMVASNVPVIGLVGSRQAYNYFMRNLGVLNYNSQYVIPLKLADHLDEVTEADLKNLDGLFVYAYKQNDKDKERAAWSKVSAFVERGGTVIVDTGSYSPEKYMDSLPEVFPVEKIESGSVGQTWQVAEKSDMFASADFTKLSPLTYESGDWTVDFASKLRSGAVVDLSIADKVVVAEKKVGAGRFIWSGMNIPYRAPYFRKNAEEEIRLFGSLMEKGFGIGKTQGLTFKVDRPRSEKVIVSADGAKGILFKENNYGGWVATLITGSKTLTLPIYEAGLDFMYVRLPESAWNTPFTLTWEYKGKIEDWIFFFVTIVGILYVLDVIVLDSRVTNKLAAPARSLTNQVKAKTGHWWSSDNE